VRHALFSVSLALGGAMLSAHVQAQEATDPPTGDAQLTDEERDEQGPVITASAAIASAALRRVLETVVRAIARAIATTLLRATDIPSRSRTASARALIVRLRA